MNACNLHNLCLHIYCSVRRTPMLEVHAIIFVDSDQEFEYLKIYFINCYLCYQLCCHQHQQRPRHQHHWFGSVRKHCIGKHPRTPVLVIQKHATPIYTRNTRFSSNPACNTPIASTRVEFQDILVELGHNPSVTTQTQDTRLRPPLLCQDPKLS